MSGEPAVHVVKNLLSDNAFASLRDFVVYSARHQGEYDEMFHRTRMNSPAALRMLHVGLADFASKLTGNKLKPSYNLVSNYLPGGKCPLHVDRDECFYTIDLMIDKDAASSWPLMVGEYWSDGRWDEHGYKDPDRYDENIQPDDLDVEWEQVELQPNEAACYSGTNSWHYRPGEAQTRTDLILFHFVKDDSDDRPD